jgi:hypothetical protein
MMASHQSSTLLLRAELKAGREELQVHSELITSGHRGESHGEAAEE